MWWWGNFQGHHGEFISAFSAPLVANNVAESLALCIGIEWCKENGINMIIVDLDSSLVISWVTGKMKPPWNLRHNIDTIQNTITTFDEFHISHCYREANKEANVLAKEGSVLENVKWYSSYQELPKQARGICYMDKHQFVSFKIRGSNSSFIFDDNG
ncbi:hypothetical protein KY285_016834 [Solanum tuberosum]|nr:hypothetical protein KY285_016834 [Solanum tuberosum]